MGRARACRTRPTAPRKEPCFPSFESVSGQAPGRLSALRDRHQLNFRVREARLSRFAMDTATSYYSTSYSRIVVFYGTVVVPVQLPVHRSFTSTRIHT
jgi:hypothetical protein